MTTELSVQNMTIQQP